MRKKINPQDHDQQADYRDPVPPAKGQVVGSKFFPMHKGFALNLASKPSLENGMKVGIWPGLCEQRFLARNQKSLPLPSFILAKYNLTSQITVN